MDELGLKFDWDSSDQLESSLPKDWLHLRPPSPSPPPSSSKFVSELNTTASSSPLFSPLQALVSPIDFQAVEVGSQMSNSLGTKSMSNGDSSSDWGFLLEKHSHIQKRRPTIPPSQKAVPASPSPISVEHSNKDCRPSGLSRDWMDTPLNTLCPHDKFENHPHKDVHLCLSTILADRQDFLSATTYFSYLDHNHCDGKKNDLSEQTRDSLPLEGSVGLNLPILNKCDNFEGNACVGNQGPERFSTICVQGNSSDVSGMGKVAEVSWQDVIDRTIESGMGKVAEVSWQDVIKRTIEADCLDFGSTYPSFKDFSSNNSQEAFEADGKVPYNKLQALFESAISSSEETVADPAVLTTNLIDFNLPNSVSVSISSAYTKPCLGSDSKSSLSLPVDCELTNILEFKANPHISKSIEPLETAMNNEDKSMLLDMNDMDAKLQKPYISGGRNIVTAVPFCSPDGQDDVGRDNMTEQIPFCTRGFLSSVTDIYPNDTPEIPNSISESERKQENRMLDSCSRFEGDFFNSSETANYLCHAVQDDLSLTDDTFFPVGNNLSGHSFSAKSKLSSFPLYESMGTISVPELTKGLIRCDNIGLQEKSDCLPCKSHGTTRLKFPESGKVDEWPQRKIDKRLGKTSNAADKYAICTGLGYSPKMDTVDHLKADYMSAGTRFITPQSSFANSKHCSKNLDCHALVENIQNSSLLLIASHSSESDILAQPDVQVLLSVLRNLSEYLTHKAGISASCIQAALHPDKDQFSDSSGIGEKDLKLDACFSRENDPADYERQISKFPDIFSASRGIHFAEDGPHMTRVLAESDPLQGAESKKLGKLSGVEKEKDSERSFCELQNMVKKLRENFECEHKERDTFREYSEIRLELQKYSERRICELQKLLEICEDRKLCELKNLVKMLRENFKREHQERDSAILLNKNLCGESQSALSSMMNEMEHIKVEVEALRVKQLRTADAHFRVGETLKNIERTLKSSVEVNLNSRENVIEQAAISQGQCHENCDVNTNLISPVDITSPMHSEMAFQKRAAVLHSHAGSLSPKCSLGVDLNPKGVVTDGAAILQYGRKDCKDAKTGTNLNSSMNDPPQAHCEESIWDRAAILFSREEIFRESDISRDMNACNHETLESPKIDTIQREEILSRCRILKECNHSDMMARDFGKQFGESVVDEPGLCNNSIQSGDNAGDNSYPESFESDQETHQYMQGEGSFWEWTTILPSLEESPVEGEMPDIREISNSKSSLEVNMNPKGNVTDLAASQVSCGKLCENPETRKNLHYLTKVTPQEQNEGRFWDPMAISFSQDESLGESDISGNLNHDTLEGSPEIDILHREECLSRFRIECDHSYMLARDSGKQFCGSISDKVFSCNTSLDIEDNATDNSCIESYESDQFCGSISDEDGSYKNSLDLENYSADNSFLETHEFDQEYNQGIIWDWAAILLSQEENLRKSDISRNLNICNHDTLQREEILRRFEVLQECSHKSDMSDIDSGKHFGKSDSRRYKYNQEHKQVIQGGLANQNIYPDTDDIQARLAVLHHREASGVKVEDDRTMIVSKNFDKQPSYTHAYEGIHDILTSAYGTKEFSDSLGQQIPMTYGKEQFLHIVPAAESFFEENALIKNISMPDQLKSFSSAPTTDVSISSQSKHFYNKIQLENSKSDSNLGELRDLFPTESSGTENKCDHVSVDDSSQISTTTSFSIPKPDSGKSNIVKVVDDSSQKLPTTSFSIPKPESDKSNIVKVMQNQSIINPSKGSADAENLNQKELGCILHCQHDFVQITLSSEVESSSTESESSWVCVEKEEDISFQC